jgi:HD-like signal output (HDOD) protein
VCHFRSGLISRPLHKKLPISVLQEVKVEVDEELWYGASSDEAAEAEAAKSMAARMGRIIGAKPFPAAAQRLSQITRDPNCQMDEVVAVLESDPALSARLLRLVNSVGFSLRTACTSVRHAAALVGTEKLNQVASTAAILDMYESGGERAKQLLEHATVVGTLCRYLAFHFGLPPDELFTCGFLHDIGKLMLLDIEGDAYLELLGPEMPEFDTTHVEERKRFGFDHALLAGHVLAAWNIPHPVPKVVAWHHHVTRAYAESTAISQMVSTLRLADAMSFALQREDRQAQIETLARMEAASYMDISEGQLAAMWDEVRALTERARAVFRGEKVDDSHFTHTSRPSGASLRAVARAKHQDRASLSAASAPPSSERSRQFPCVVCGGPSYAHRCAACRGYMCPLHVAGEDEWCQLCRGEYEEAGIPSIRPLVSTLVGALAGALVAAAFFGAASAGAQRPLRIMIGPTLILMLLGMLAGVGQRWIRRWWFLRSRPSRASIVPKAVEAVLDSAAQQNPQIVELEEVPALLSSIEAEPISSASSADSPSTSEAVPSAENSHLMNPEIPALPALPLLDPPPPLRSTPPRSTPPRERTWMSSRTPAPPALGERPGSLPPLPRERPLEPFAEATSFKPAATTPKPAPPEPPAEPERALVEAQPEPLASRDETPNEEIPQEMEAPPAEARAEERPSEPLPASEERVVEHAAQEDMPALAAGQAAGSSRPSARSSGSTRPQPANDARPSGFGTRAERARAARTSGPPRIASERPPTRRLPSAPPPSQRPRPPVVASVRPRLPANPSEPPTLRPVSAAPPRSPDSVAATLLQVPAVPDAEPLRSSIPVSDSSPSAEPARNAPAAPVNAAWSKLLDDQGTAGGW